MTQKTPQMKCLYLENYSLNLGKLEQKDRSLPWLLDTLKVQSPHVDLLSNKSYFSGTCAALVRLISELSDRYSVQHQKASKNCQSCLAILLKNVIALCVRSPRRHLRRPSIARNSSANSILTLCCKSPKFC